jgi:acetyl/propionyl-CoA carboxylase alpha subunit
MFRRVLVANRAEIAIRICRTLREMGIESVAVFSEADRGMPHVRAADRAFELGPAAPSQSYLNIERIIDAAKATGADAVIPGYGFLAERADFALACRAAGLVFIGPEPEAIAAMGEKQRARSLMASAGVPLVPGAAANTLEEAEREARRIGFPVLLKAVAGGGGKGMRLVENERSLPSAFETAAREAERAFGNGQLYLEKALQRVRHVEIQVWRINTATSHTCSSATVPSSAATRRSSRKPRAHTCRS